MTIENQPLIYRLRKRAEIRRQIDTRKSVQEGKPDRLANLLEEAANQLTEFAKEILFRDTVFNRFGDPICGFCGTILDRPGDDWHPYDCPVNKAKAILEKYNE